MTSAKEAIGALWRDELPNNRKCPFGPNLKCKVTFTPNQSVTTEVYDHVASHITQQRTGRHRGSVPGFQLDLCQLPVSHGDEQWRKCGWAKPSLANVNLATAEDAVSVPTLRLPALEHHELVHGLPCIAPSQSVLDRPATSQRPGKWQLTLVQRDLYTKELRENEVVKMQRTGVTTGCPWCLQNPHLSDLDRTIGLHISTGNFQHCEASYLRAHLIMSHIIELDCTKLRCPFPTCAHATHPWEDLMLDFLNHLVEVHDLDLGVNPHKEHLSSGAVFKLASLSDLKRPTERGRAGARKQLQYDDFIARAQKHDDALARGRNKRRRGVRVVDALDDIDAE